MDYQTILTTVGEKVSQIASKAISYLTGQTASSIISIIVLLSLGYLALKIAQPVIKWTIILLIVFLVISTGYTFVS